MDSSTDEGIPPNPSAQEVQSAIFYALASAIPGNDTAPNSSSASAIKSLEIVRDDVELSGVTPAPLLWLGSSIPPSIMQAPPTSLVSQSSGPDHSPSDLAVPQPFVHPNLATFTPRTLNSLNDHDSDSDAGDSYGEKSAEYRHQPRESDMMSSIDDKKVPEIRSEIEASEKANSVHESVVDDISTRDDDFTRHSEDEVVADEVATPPSSSISLLLSPLLIHTTLLSETPVERLPDHILPDLLAPGYMLPIAPIGVASNWRMRALEEEPLSASLRPSPPNSPRSKNSRRVRKVSPSRLVRPTIQPPRPFTGSAFSESPSLQTSSKINMQVAAPSSLSTPAQRLYRKATPATPFVSNITHKNNTSKPLPEPRSSPSAGSLQTTPKPPPRPSAANTCRTYNPLEELKEAIESIDSNSSQHGVDIAEAPNTEELNRLRGVSLPMSTLIENLNDFTLLTMQIEEENE